MNHLRDKVKIFRVAQESKEYMLEDGMLYDENADDVFNMKELISYNVPLLRDPQEANDFLEELERKTNRTFGRVPNKNFMKEVRYKDTNKEKQIENLKLLDERNKRLKRGEF